MPSFFRSHLLVYGTAVALRAVLLFYGVWQDAHSAVKYTDIDYMVFTDASRYVSRGASPYARDTYRYTPLLAWMLLPTSWTAAPGLFSFGKALFALSDILAGWLIEKSLISSYRMNPYRALKYASFWLLNPMVANISTRGSSEGLLGVLVISLLWAVLNRRITLAGVLLGLSVHFKIYPFVYGVSILWWLDNEREQGPNAEHLQHSNPERQHPHQRHHQVAGSGRKSTTSAKAESESPKTQVATERREPEPKIPAVRQILDFLTPSRVRLTLTSLVTFFALNFAMHFRYGFPFLQHTFLHHLTRIDHRHNFSPYSTLLYLSAAGDVHGNFESLAFVPQLLLSVVLIPLVLARKSLPGAMLAQTFTFVTFNKVCTSQYFLWYLIFLPFYLPTSSLLHKPKLGLSVAALWVIAQALWLQQGYYLEFLGQPSFVPGLFLSSLAFFSINVWILGIIIRDVGDVRQVN